MTKRIEAFEPDIPSASGLATCNVYVTAHMLEMAKKSKPDVTTVTGGQHFTVLLRKVEVYPEIDVIVRAQVKKHCWSSRWGKLRKLCRTESSS